jgi:hypothetical protein
MNLHYSENQKAEVQQFFYNTIVLLVHRNSIFPHIQAVAEPGESVFDVNCIFGFKNLKTTNNNKNKSFLTKLKSMKVYI